MTLVIGLSPAALSCQHPRVTALLSAAIELNIGWILILGQLTGVAAAIEEDDGPSFGAGADHQPADDQGALFEEVLTAEDAELEKPFGLSLPGRGAGRPPGSRNKSTEQTKKLIRTMGGDPQLALARIVRGGPLFLICQAQAIQVAAYGEREDLDGTELVRGVDADGRPLDAKGKPLEVLPVSAAIMEWRRCCEVLAPYMMAKAPVEINLNTDGLAVRINMAPGGGAKPAIGGDQGSVSGTLTIPMISDTYEDDPEEVASGKSPDEANPLKTWGE